MNVWRILQGDVCERLASLPAESVQTCVTSPPYWGLRDYGHAGQIGLEPTPSEYVARMVEVFAEVHRVLREDGTLWLNLGDSYANTGAADSSKVGGFTGARIRAGAKGIMDSRPRKIPEGIKQKDLVGIPWMVAFALRDYGWYLRSEIIWHKPNPMPESVTDRPTKSHEQIFLFSKSARYYYDAEAIKEPVAHPDMTHRSAKVSAAQTAAFRGNAPTNIGRCGTDPESGRNKRSVWTVATQPYPEAHFATYPEALIEPCILAGSSERGQCPACGAPWERVVERTPAEVLSSKSSYGHGAGRNDGGRSMLVGARAETIGWKPSCACDAGDPVPQLVLDPFTGSGTTGAVAIRHQRSFVGTELNPAYIDLARKRIGSVAPMFARECGEELVDVLARQA